MDVMKSFSLEGKVALVTGAAYGIGLPLQKLTQKQAQKLCLTAEARNTWILL